MNLALPAAGVLAAAAFLAWRTSQQATEYATPETTDAPETQLWGDVDPMSDTVPVEGDSQTTGLITDAFVAFTPSTYLGGGTDDNTGNANVIAFLDMIAYAEGTAGPDGYRAIFGYPKAGRLMDSFADHPRTLYSFTNSKGQTLKTSAAGRYQFLASTWDELRKKLGLHDFGPASQDAGAIELIRQRGALNDVRAGRIANAIDKVRTVWASLPGAGYSQPERSLTTLLAAYQTAGGTFA